MFRSRICSFINQFKYIDSFMTETDVEIQKSLQTTKTFIKNNPDIIFMKADKDNTVVALDRQDYVNKMETLLSDKNKYSMLQRNSVNKVLRELVKAQNNVKTLD